MSVAKFIVELDNKKDRLFPTKREWSKIVLMAKEEMNKGSWPQVDTTTSKEIKKTRGEHY